MRSRSSKTFADRVSLRGGTQYGRAAALFLTLAASVSVPPSAHADPQQSPEADKSKTGQAAQPENGAQALAPSAQEPGTPTAPQIFDVYEYRIEGADTLEQSEVEEAVYPYLGEGRTPADVEKARAAVEKKYHDKGLQTVSVAVRHQDIDDKYVAFSVTEMRVGHVRVTNSKYHDLDTIKKSARSLKPGVLPDFDDATKDIVALNQWPDRRVTPALRAGVTPGTVDVDLNVEDKLPLHASVELNNRQSPNTTDLRVNGTIHYDNLWQRGHSLSFTYQTAPERRDDMEAFSASYLTRIPDVEWLSVLTYGVISRSDVALLGDINVVGPGETFGMRGVITLPSKESFYHSLSVGLDYKHFGQTLEVGGDAFDSPIGYFPLVAAYSASLQIEKSLTQLSATVTHGLRGFGSDSWLEWDTKRYMAAPNFFTFNAELTETYDLPEGFQLFGRIGGQLADQPLVSSEQYSIGGLQTVRGYLESTALGDSGTSGSIELRSPDIGSMLQTELEKSGHAPKDRKLFNEWRLFAFLDAGFAMIHEPLVEQDPRVTLWSYGVGTTFKALDHLNGMVAVAIPEAEDSNIEEGEPRVLFRIWGEL